MVYIIPKGIKILFKSQFIVQFLTIFGSTLLVAKLYGPESFGQYNLIQLLSIAFIPIVGLSFHYALFNKNIKITLYEIILGILFFQIFIVLIIVFPIYKFKLVENINILEVYLFSICILVYEVLRTNSVSKKDFELVSKVDIYLISLSISIKYIAFYMDNSYESLYYSQIISFLICILIFLFNNKNIRSNLDFNFIIFFQKIRNISINKTPQLLLNRVGGIIVPFAISIVSGPQSVAFYSFSRALILLPGRSISTVLYDFFSSNKIKEKNYNLLLQLSILIIFIGIIICILYETLSINVFSYVMGDEWSEINSFIQPFILWGCAVIASSFWIGIGNQFSLHNIVLYNEIFHVIGRIIFCILLLNNIINLFSFVWGIGVLGMLINLTIILSLYDKSKKFQ